jgi:hypothetical protein
MENQDQPIQTPDGRTVIVDFFKPQDAEGIAALFREVYGEGYPVRIFYEPEALIHANETGDYCSIVARNELGQVVGVQHLFHSAPYKGIYENGAGLIQKAYRSQGINKKMEWFVFHRWTPARPQVAGIFGEAVCNHVHMQKTVHDLGAVDMSLEAALMPAEAYMAEKSARGRVACILGFWPIREKPHRVYLPPAYAEALLFLYSGLTEERSFSPSAAPLPADRATQHQVTVFDFASVARVAFQETGADVGNSVEDMEREARGKRVKVIQVWLKLGSPWVGAAVDVFRDKGYFLGGLLPRWFDQDGLLMQKLFCPPDWEGIHLYTDRAKEILKMVREDEDGVTSRKGKTPWPRDA